MPAPTEQSTGKEMKQYITDHKLNIKKNQTKPQLLKAIRAAGHRGTKKPPAIPYNVKGRRVINPKTGKARKRAENKDILGAPPGPAAAKAKAKAMAKSKNKKEKVTPKKKPTPKPVSQEEDEDDEHFQVTVKGIKYQVSREDNQVIREDNFDHVGMYDTTTKKIIFFTTTQKYQNEARRVFNNHKSFFGKDHYARVEIQGYGDANWDGYNLYAMGLSRAGNKIGTYQNEKDLEEWKDYGRAQAFTKYDPLELKRGAKGLKMK